MKLGRHKGMEVKCGQCDKPFIAIAKRVEIGLGKYCSKECFDIWQRENRKSPRFGKENAKAYPNKKNGGYFVQWFNEEGRAVNSPWHRWAWELNKGPIPEGYVVEYVDGDKSNIVLENLQLRLTRRGKKLFPKPPRKKVSLETRNKISENNMRLWREGVYDVHKGSFHRNYKEIKFRHPKEFSRSLKEFIRERDNHICQICGEDLVGKSQPVHHIDGIKANNHPDNLILVCTSCHAKIHFTKDSTDPVIMAFHSKLLE